MFIFDIGFSIIDALLLIFGINLIINIQGKIKLKIIFSVFISLIAMITYTNLPNADLIATILGLLCYIIYLAIASDKNYKENILIGIISFIIIGIISIIFNQLFVDIIKSSDNLIKEVVIFSSKLTILFIIYIVYYFKRKYTDKWGENKLNINFKKTNHLKELITIITFYCIIISQLLLTYYIVTILGRYRQFNLVIGLYIISIISLVMISFFIIYIVSKLYEAQYKENELKIYLQKEMEILSKSNNDYEKLQILRHDFKHYLAVIKEMIDKCTNEEIYQFIDETVDKVNKDTAYRVKLSSKLLEAVINSKLDEMKNLGITVHSFLVDVNNINNESKMSIVLMNLLDNAKEGALKSDEKEVSINSYIKNNYIVYQIINSANEDAFVEDNIKVTKKNGEYRGLGLKSVKKILEEENGFIKFEKKNGKFIVTIKIKK